MRYLVGVLVGTVAILPLLVTLFVKSPYYISTEFIAYRFGDSLTLKYGDRSSVRPVQGIPTAILARLVLGLDPRYSLQEQITRDDLNHYARTFALVAAAIVLLLCVVSWTNLDFVDALIVSLFLLAPWYFGVASMALLLSPEYWIGEWLWLSTMLFLFVKTDHFFAQLRPSALMSFSLGAWLAVGVSTKISLLGITPFVFLLLLPGFTFSRFFRSSVVFVIGFLLSYIVILCVYMGSFHQGWSLLAYQVAFFHSPNHSAEYLNWIDALSHKPEVAMLLGFVAVESIALTMCSKFRVGAMWRPFFAMFSILLWVAAYLLMLARRPHDSTLTSISLSALFLTSYAILMVRRERRAVILICVSGGLVGIAALARFPAERELSAIINSVYGDEISADALTAEANHASTAIWYIPSNSWNAVLLPQLLGYNGGLGLYPVQDNGGQLYYNGAEVFKTFWPHSFILGASTSELDKMRLALLKGATVFYTRPKLDNNVGPDRYRDQLVATVHEADRILVEKDVYYNGHHWVFGYSQ